MSRTKLDDERIPQILDAFQRCIVKYGLAESSLERVAKEAGLARTLIHHYIGGRNDVLELWLERVTQNRQDMFDNLTATTVESFLAQLQMQNNALLAVPDTQIIQNELEAAAARDPEIRGILKRRTEHFLQTLASHLAKLYPQAIEQRCLDAAYVLVALFQGHTGLRETGVGQPSARTLLQAAHTMLDQLLSQPDQNP